MSDSFMKQTIVPSGAMTGTTTIKSQAFSMLRTSGCSFQPIWTGTPTGAFTIMVSNDFQPSLSGDQTNPINAGTWSDLGATIPTNPAGSVGSTFVPIFAPCTYWIALWYTNASGSGVLGGTFVSKYGG
jgi:hypothetical protein